MDIRPYSDLLRSEIRMIELRLGVVGSGIWTPELRKALDAFRISHHIEISDGYDDETAEALGSIVIVGNTPILPQTLIVGEAERETFVTPHFRWNDFASHGDGQPVPDQYMANVRALCSQLEIVRKILGNREIRIISGWRSAWWNKRIGGYPYSAHMDGLAVDFTVDGLHPSSVRRLMESLMERGEIFDGGLGRMAQYTHYDIAQPHKRWS